MTINCRNPQALICHDFILLLLLSFSSFWLFTYPMCLFVVAPIFLSFYSCLSLFLLRFLFFHCFCCCFHLLSVAGPTTSKGARAALLWHLPGVSFLLLSSIVFNCPQLQLQYLILIFPSHTSFNFFLLSVQQPIQPIPFFQRLV